MKQVLIEDEILIGAKPATVWEAIKNTEAHAKWHPFLAKIEGSHELGGTRSCAVKIGGKVAHTSEQCVADDTMQRILWRINEDSSGFLRMAADWTAGFSLRGVDRSTVVTAQSAFRPRNMLVRLMMPFVRRKFHATQKAILEGLREHMESRR